jgi:serine/threonine-protein kinase
MNAEQWKQVQTLFKEIVDLEPDTRRSRLETVRTEDPLLYDELLSLLKADSQDTSLIDGYAVEQVDLSDLVPLDGVRIGPYEIAAKIGTGGMGNVYLAHRVEGGFEQTVALKLTKYGMGSPHAIQRFEAERSILASLQHPNIARLIDGGITDEGRPWFAMEYVQGENLISWSRRLNLPVKQRLELFLKISEAVQYAHKKLIVHRDLKPANIMVTGDDSNPQVRLLDFGIAQILEGPDDPGSERRAMTRAYASPEQRDGRPTSTASDIYSLGVILHQLLAGCHPDPKFRPEDCRPAPVHRELASICSKALQEDPEQRFQNASEMSDQIRAWLEERPVSAYSTAPLYRTGKWLNRNRAASFIGIFSLISIIILIFVYTQELQIETERAQNEANRATRIASVLGSSLLSIDPMQNQGEELTALGMVDMSSAYINSELKEDPLTRSELLILMADVYANLIALEKADSVSAVAVSLYKESQQDTTSFTYINMLADRSIILDKTGKYEEAMDVMQQALTLADENLEPGSLEIASVYLDYTYHLDINQDYATADSVLSILEPIYENNAEEAGQTYDDFVFYMGTNYRRLGEFELAEEYLFRSLELSRDRYPGIHEKIASTLNHISSLYQNMGRYEDAIPYAIDAHEMRLEIFGPGHLNTLAAHSNTARAYGGAGRLEESAETYRDVLEIFREEYGNDNFYIAGILQSYGNVYMRMEDYALAEEIMREALEHSERLLPPDHIRQAYPLKGLADALRSQQRCSEAMPYAERAFTLRSNQLPEDHPDLITTRYTLGRCLWDLDRREEAEDHLRDALAFFRDNPDRFETQIGELEELGFR